MAVKKNMNEKKPEKKEKGKWQISVIVDSPKEALMLAESEHLPQPDENFYAYPAPAIFPKLYTYFQMIKKVYKFSSMGIYSKAIKLK